MELNLSQKVFSEFNHKGLNIQNTKFNEKFTSIDWNSLVKQSDKISTDDGCVYYMNVNESYEKSSLKVIYSWNFIDEEWEKLTKKEAIEIYDAELFVN